MPSISTDYEIVDGNLHIIISSEDIYNILKSNIDKEKAISPKRTNSKRKEPAGKRKLSARQSAIAALEVEFAVKTKLPMPRRGTVAQKKAAAKMWWSHLGELWELCDKDADKALRVMRDTIAQMQTNTPPLTIIAPSSIINMARTNIAGSASTMEVW